MLLYATITLLLVTSGTRADYDCVCNYNTDLEVYTTADVQSAIVGRMYEFDCKPRSVVAAPTSGFLAVQFENKVGYVTLNDQVQVQTCSGQPSPDDLVSTTSTTSTTTKTVVTSMEPATTTQRKTSPVMTTRIATPLRTYKTTTRSTTRFTTTIPPTTRKSTPQLTTTTQTIPPTTRRSTPQMTTTTQTIPPTTRTSTPQLTTKASSTMTPISSTRPSTVISTTQHTDVSSTPIIKDHIEACPDHVRSDVNLKGGFLGQYGDFCFEVVDWLRPFDAAESHCKITSGHLVAITNQQEQEYINGLMARNHFVNASWIGLNDKDGEGVYTWTSGAPVTYKNFQGEFNQQSTQDHKLHDCFVIKQGGEWSDVPCGVAISFFGIGESHPFICQYNISAKVQSLFEIIPEFVG